MEYAHGQEEEEIDQAPGRIDRISVGIVIPSILATAQIAKLTDVVSAGLGLDAARGDKVDVAAIAPPEQIPAGAAASHTNVAALDGATTPLAADIDTTAVTLQATQHWWIYAVIAALVLTILAAILIAGRTSTPHRLTLSEREEALLRLRQWIEASEVER